MVKKSKIKRLEKKLKVSHVVPATPGACGMYETARELVLAERRLGINAHIVDPRPTEEQAKGKSQKQIKKIKCPKCKSDFDMILSERPMPHGPKGWTEDRGVSIAPHSFLYESDVIVSHSGLGDNFNDCNVPRIHVAHGRPNSSYRIEQSGQTPIYSIYKKMNDDPKWKVMVTLWPSFKKYWELIFKDVRAFNSFVDLDHWQRTDELYDFGGKKGDVNVVITDIWRMDKDPFHVVNAFALFAEKVPNAKLHVYGLSPNSRGRDVLFYSLNEKGFMGEMKPHVDDLKPIYSAADMLITPHNMATRTVRESLACGTQLIAGSGNPFTSYTADPEDLEAYSNVMERASIDWKNDKEACIIRNRKIAEKEFNAMDTAQQFVNLFNEIRGVA